MDEALAWIRGNAIPLTSVEAGHGFADLEPLRAIIGDAETVRAGLAEKAKRTNVDELFVMASGPSLEARIRSLTLIKG